MTPKERPYGPLTFTHTNGWTMSVNHNIGPGYSVIAYPTAKGYNGAEDHDRLFVFEGGQSEGWCASLSGLVTLAQEVMNARPPT